MRRGDIFIYSFTFFFFSVSLVSLFFSFLFFSLFITPHLVCLFNLEMIFSFSHSCVNVHECHECHDASISKRQCTAYLWL